MKQLLIVEVPETNTPEQSEAVKEEIRKELARTDGKVAIVAIKKGTLIHLWEVEERRK